MPNQPNTSPDAPASTISAAKHLANIANATHSTGPRTEAGKTRSAMNARRHGLTGQFYVMNEDDRRAYNIFEKSILDALALVGAYETQYAVSIAQDHWRLNRSRAIEDNTYGLGHHEHADEIATSSPETEAAISQAKTWRDGNQGFTNITLYEARIRRMIAQNEKRLEELQQRRRTLEAQAREEAELLLCQSVMNGEQLTEDKPLLVRGFVFSPTQIIAAIRHREALESARFYRSNGWDNSERWREGFNFPPVAPQTLRPDLQ